MLPAFAPLSVKILKISRHQKAVITNQQVTRGFSNGWMGSLPALPTRCCPSSRNRVVSWLLRAQNSCLCSVRSVKTAHTAHVAIIETLRPGNLLSGLSSIRSTVPASPSHKFTARALPLAFCIPRSRAPDPGTAYLRCYGACSSGPAVLGS